MLCQRVNCNEVGEDFKHPLSFISGHNLSSFGKESCRIVSNIHRLCCHKASFNRTIFGILKRASIDDLFFQAKSVLMWVFQAKSVLMWVESVFLLFSLILFHFLQPWRCFEKSSQLHISHDWGNRLNKWADHLV